MIIDERTDQSEREGLMDIALTACLMLAELEGELVCHPKACVVDHEAAADLWLMAQTGCTAVQAGCYMQSIEGRRAD